MSAVMASKSRPPRSSTFSEWFYGADPQHVPLCTQGRTHARIPVHAFIIRERAHKRHHLPRTKLRLLQFRKWSNFTTSGVSAELTPEPGRHTQRYRGKRGARDRTPVQGVRNGKNDFQSVKCLIGDHFGIANATQSPL